MIEKDHIQEPFKVPEGYFDQLYDSITAAKQEKATLFQRMRQYTKPVYAVGIPMLILVLIVLGTGLWKVDGVPAKDCIELSCLGDAELEQAAETLDLDAVMDFAAADSTFRIEQDLSITEESEYLDEL
ncbi:MAG: hypothetical protein V4616_10080 [Bacteroidota bacterium]